MISMYFTGSTVTTVVKARRIHHGLNCKCTVPLSFWRQFQPWTYFSRL